MKKELATTQQALTTLDAGIIASMVTAGDLSKLNDQQLTQYYNYRCQQAGLDAAATPFTVLTLNGKKILYANATATQQLTGLNKLSTEIISKTIEFGVMQVVVKVSSPDGRSTQNIGATNVDNLKGENLANAMMKATTKAIRRSVLAHLGLGMLDETEVATIQQETPQSGITDEQLLERLNSCLSEQEVIALGHEYGALLKSRKDLQPHFKERKQQLKEQSDKAALTEEAETPTV